MVETVNEQLQDADIDNAVDIQQYATGVVLAVMKALNKFDAELVAAISVAIEQIPREQFTVDRFEALLSSVLAINAQAYEAAMAALQTELSGLAEHEADWSYATLVAILPLSVQRKYPVIAVAPAPALAEAVSTPIQGHTLAEWMRVNQQSRIASIVRAVTSAVMEGLPVSEILTRIRGTKLGKYADGVLHRARTDLETIIKTAIGAIAESVKESFWRNNDELVEAVRWISVLDSRTSHYCIARANKLYTAVTHKPIGHKVPWLQGPGLLHFRCRSTATRVIKSWRQLGLTGLSEQDRALMSGEVPIEPTYSEWLSRQTASRQDQILGKERGLLYRNGDLSFSQMFNTNGQWLNLEQLRARIRG